MKKYKHIILTAFLGCTVISTVVAGDIDFFAFSTVEDIDYAASQVSIAAKEYNKNPQKESAAERYSDTLHENIAVNEELKVKSTLKKLESLAEQFPNNAVIQTYHASAICISARDVWFVPMRLLNVNKCTKMLDKIVENNPTAYVVRAIRAGNSISLPEMFDRRGLAIEDTKVLLGAPKGSIDIDNIEQRLATQLVVLYGDGEDKANQQLAFEQLQSMNPKAELLKVAKDSLI